TQKAATANWPMLIYSHPSAPPLPYGVQFMFVSLIIPPLTLHPGSAISIAV
ncbi:hypothetical protein BaRGS_00034540, partial [Batillaria attramentaria]